MKFKINFICILLLAVIKCNRAGLTYPGTKWCGPGDSASNYDDLGTLKDQDICCRAHDHCPDNIKPFRKKFGLTNWSIFTRSSCECDEELRRCLRATGPKVSTIGWIYFKVASKKCYKKEYPIIGCKKSNGLLNLKCLEFELDYCKPKVYQWFNAPEYNN